MKQKTAAVQSETVKIVDFFVGGEEYGLELSEVQEIIRVPEITPLPQTAEFVKGVINLRGTVIPLIDLRLRFSCPTADYTPLTRAIIVNIEDKQTGFVIDSVTRVIRLNTDDISPPPEKIGGISKEYISGVGKKEESLIIILNHKKILTAKEADIIKEIDNGVQ